MGESILKLQQIRKSFDHTEVLKGVDLEVAQGEFITLLGASGCGKTTLLRMIAGFNSVDGGEICFDDKVINNLEAHKRDIGMVFQHFNLFPNLSVRRNMTLAPVQLGLMTRQEADAEAQRLLESEDTPSELRNLEQVTAKDVMDLAKAGDGLACRVADFFGDSLGRALASVSCVCDPEIIVLGGGVSKAGSYIVDLVQTAFLKYAFPAAEPTKFALAALGNNAGIYGAASLALQK